MKKLLSKYSLTIVLLIIFLVLFNIIQSCGGGGGEGASPPSYSVWIMEPSPYGAYLTDRSTVHLKGGSVAPDGSSCPGIVGVLPPSYDVTWYNSLNGVSGYASFHLNCLFVVFVVWDTGDIIPLDLGANSITVTADDGAGHVGQDTIIVTRVQDTTPPIVVSASPFAGSTGIAINMSVVVTFSEEMDPATINSTTITLKDGVGNPIPAAATYSGYSLSARLTPTNLLSYNTNYQATVTTGVQDASGNPLATPYVFSFTTGLNPDTTPPSVQSVSPADGSYCASTTGAVSATFNEDLDPATVNGTTFTLSGAGSQTVSGTVNYINRNASFSPAAALPWSSPFTATLTTGIKDLAGNTLASSYQWNFTTLASHGVGTWAPTSSTGVPFARDDHVAVWTGSEMIVSGGLAWDSDWNWFDYTSQYGRYNPITGTWTVSTGAPAAVYQKAVWTGSLMLVWGGYISGSAVSGGASYNLGTDTWANLSIANQPSARYDHTVVWTGSEMIVWGGRNGTGSIFGGGARYNPVSNTWQTISTSSAPSARYGHTAFWTGSEMIIWGGSGTGDGARYNPTADTWTPISSIGAPTARLGHVAVWTGSEMIIWGNMYGSTNTGGLYNPVTDSWRPTDSLCAPSGRWRAPAIWTGSKMVIWGGTTVSSYFSNGYVYDPLMNTWLEITTTGAPSARADHTAIWTGSQVILWGGSGTGGSSSVLNSGGQLTP